MNSDHLWFDLPGLTEAEIARLINAMKRVDQARAEFRKKTSGFTEPPAVRASRWPDAYHDAEHDRRLDIILRDITLR